MERGVPLAAIRHGRACTAVVDAPNLAAEVVAVLAANSANSDASAEDLRRTIAAETRVAFGVVISNAFGRAW